MRTLAQPLTELGRLRLARCVVDDGWPLRRAAERSQVSVSTACRWANRYREQGPADMADRCSRPLTARTGQRPVWNRASSKSGWTADGDLPASLTCSA